MLTHLIERRIGVGKTMRQALQQNFEDRMTNWHRLNGIRSHLSWDQQTIMPEKAATGRGETLSWLAGQAHNHITDGKLDEIVSLLEEGIGDLDEDDACNVRRMRREIDMATKLPVSLVEEMASAVSEARQVWEDARAVGDFAMFAPSLQKIIDLTKAKMSYLGGDSGNYNVLLDEYEIGMTMADYDPLFKGLRGRLVPLLEKIMKVQSEKPELNLPDGMQFATADQDSFCRFVSATMGFDFAAGRLDTTTHPFCSGLAVGDTRITTRYDESDPFSCLYAVMHESGHGLYEQGLPNQHSLRPRGQAISLGVHESQSRLWENQIGRTTAFWQVVLDSFRQKFPDLPQDLGADEMNRIANGVKPSFIRVEADEITYNLHIMLRYEIEKKIFEEDLPVSEIPAVWNTMFAEWFGIEVPDDSLGCLQDVHWSCGAFGYFPTYTLGNLYAAQLCAKMVDDLGDLDEVIRSGDWSPILAWLREKIHSHGMLYDPSELIERATGQPPSPEPFLDYIEKKYSQIYGL